MGFEEEFGLLWDIDGVVADSPHEASWRQVAEKPEWGIEGLDSKFYMDYVASRPRFEGANNILTLLKGYEKKGADTEEKKRELMEKYAAQKNKIIVDLIKNEKFGVFESSVLMIAEAKDRGMKLGAASASKNANTMLTKIKVKPILEKNKAKVPGFVKDDTMVYDLFDTNYCGKSVPGGKAELFKLAADAIAGMTGGRTKKFIVFEDGTSGIEAGKKNGYYGVGIIRIGTREDFEKAGADIIVNDLSEISLDEIKEEITKK